MRTPKSDKLSKDAQANDHLSTDDGVVAEPSGHTTVIDTVGLSSVPKLVATSAKAVNLRVMRLLLDKGAATRGSG